VIALRARYGRSFTATLRTPPSISTRPAPTSYLTGEQAMPNQSHLTHFHMDGEAAFMDGLSIDQNPYGRYDDAAEAWQGGWMAAYAASRSAESYSLEQRA
jgi:hypothetical protein